MRCHGGEEGNDSKRRPLATPIARGSSTTHWSSASPIPCFLAPVCRGASSPAAPDARQHVLAGAPLVSRSLPLPLLQRPPATTAAAATQGAAAQRHRLPPPRLQEEEFWAGRLLLLQQQKPAATSTTAAAPGFIIPAHVPQRAASPQPQLAVAASEAPSPKALIPAVPAAPASAAGTAALAAQVEALKLQVAQLRRSNAHLSQQLAAAGVERAAAAKQAALARLTQLQLDSRDPPPASAAVEVLQAELGVALPPGADAVPLACLETLHGSYCTRLAQLQQQHAAALDRQQQEHAAAMEQLQAEHARLMQRQVRVAFSCPMGHGHTLHTPASHALHPSCPQAAQHDREARLLADAADDPAREAEAQLLRDDCAYLKASLARLGVEYQQRVEVAAAEARLAARREAAEQARQLEAQAAEERQDLVRQLAAAQHTAAADQRAAEEVAALQRASHGAELARLKEQHEGELAAVKVRWRGAAAAAWRGCRLACKLCTTCPIPSPCRPIPPCPAGRVRRRRGATGAPVLRPAGGAAGGALLHEQRRAQQGGHAAGDAAAGPASAGRGRALAARGTRGQPRACCPAAAAQPAARAADGAAISRRGGAAQLAAGGAAAAGPQELSHGAAV